MLDLHGVIVIGFLKLLGNLFGQEVIMIEVVSLLILFYNVRYLRQYLFDVLSMYQF